MNCIKLIWGQNRIVTISFFFGIQLIVAFTSLFIREYFELDMPASKYDLESSIKDNIVFIIIGMAILIPTVEEVIFRMFLSLQLNQIVWSFIAGNIYLFLIGGNYLLLDVIYVGFLLFILFLAIRKSISGIDLRRRYLVLISITIFSLIHLNNYQLDSWSQILTYLPFMVGVQFLLGIFTSFLRLAYSFKYALMFHSFYNFTLFMISYFAMQ